MWLGQYRLWPRPDLKWDKYYFVANKRKIFGEQQKIIADTYLKAAWCSSSRAAVAGLLVASSSLRRGRVLSTSHGCNRIN